MVTRIISTTCHNCGVVFPVGATTLVLRVFHQTNLYNGASKSRSRSANLLSARSTSRLSTFSDIFLNLVILGHSGVDFVTI